MVVSPKSFTHRSGVPVPGGAGGRERPLGTPEDSGRDVAGGAQPRDRELMMASEGKTI